MPSKTNLRAGDTQQFRATVSNTDDPSVKWSIEPPIGSVSLDGLYTAPPFLFKAQSVNVTATSSQFSDCAATATVRLRASTTVSISPATAQLGPAESQQFTATVNGSTGAAVKWAVSPLVGSVSSTGLYTAPDTLSGSQAVAVTATSAEDATGSASASVTLEASPEVFSIGTTSLPAGVVGNPYSTTIAVTGGTAPYTFSLASGQLPAGLSLSATGSLSGTPTAAGSSSFSIQARDAAGQIASRAFNLSIIAGLSITTSSLPDGALGTAYSATLSASGGTAPYTWSILSGLLPTGVGLVTTTGVISGIPLTGGAYNVTVQVSDAVGQQASKSFSLVIAVALAITTTALPDGSIGVAYVGAVVAMGGTSPISWAIASGQLPPGLGLDPASGALSGTPSTAGAYNFTVRAADSSSQQQTDSKSLSVNVAAPQSGKDEYGGLLSLPSPNPATGNWRLEKINNRWRFITPLNNAYNFVAPYNIGDYGNVARKYSGSNCAHVEAIASRMAAWEITGIGITTYSSVWPWVPQGCWPNDPVLGDHFMPVQYRKPAVLSLMTSLNAVLGRTWSYVPNTLDQPVHSFHLTINPVLGSGGTLTSGSKQEPDFFDSRLYSYFSYLAQNQAEIKPWWTAHPALKKYLLGVTTDEADQMFSFTTGGDNPATMTGNEHVHGGLQALRISPLQYATERGMSFIYPDPRIRVKAVGLRNYLKNKYGTIERLNSAWASTYSACDMEGVGDDFGSCGTQITAEPFATADGSSSTYTHTLAHLTPSWNSVGIFVNGVLVGGDSAFSVFASTFPITSSNPALMRIVVSGNVATAYFSYNTQLIAGHAITVSGSTTPALNGRFVILTFNVTGSTSNITFATSGVPNATYSNVGLAVSEPPYANGQMAPAAPVDIWGPQLDQGRSFINYATGSAQVTFRPASYGIASIVGNGNTVTVRCGSNTAFAPNQHGTWVGAHVTISGTNNYNMAGAVVSGIVDSYTFTIAGSAAGPEEFVGLAAFTDTSPPSGAAITVSYVQNGWGIGNGVMDEDGRHSTCLGAIEPGSTSGVDLSDCDGSLTSPGTSWVTGQSLGTLRTYNGNYMGYQFTVGSSPITVTELGRWKVDGNVQTHPIWIAAAATKANVPGAYVAIDTVNNPGVSGSYQWRALANPVTLDANTAYIIYSTEGADKFYDCDTVFTGTTGVATFRNGVSGNSALADVCAGAFVPLNFKYQTGPAVPHYNTTQIRMDLENFLGAMATEYFSNIDARFSALFGGGASRTVLNFGLDPLIYWASPSHAGVLGAAGRYTDVLQMQSHMNGYSMTQTKLDWIRANAGDVPLLNVDFITANPDSAMRDHPGNSAWTHFSTQAARGAGYLNLITGLRSLAYANGGSYPYVGTHFWQWPDSPGEGENFGMVTIIDNAYDGHESVTNAIACTSPLNAYSCGGETYNSGDFITWLKAANALWLLP